MVSLLYSVCSFTCAVILALQLISTQSLLRKDHRVDRMFLLLRRWIIMFCVADGLWGIAAGPLLMSDTVLFALSIVFHTFAAFTPCVWLAFLLVFHGKKKYNQALTIFVFLLFIAQLILILVNCKTHALFYVNEDGIYCSTPLRRLLFYVQYSVYVLSGLISLLGAWNAKRNKKSGAEFQNTLAIASFVAAPILLGIFQMLYPDAPAYSIGYTVGCCIIYSSIVTNMFKTRLMDDGAAREKQHQAEIIQTFTAKFESVYLVNLAEDTVTALAIAEQFAKNYSSFTSLSALAHTYADNEIFPEDRAMILSEISPSTMRAHLTKERSYDIDFRIGAAHSILHWRRMSVRLLGGNNVILGFSDVDDKVNRQIVSDKLLSEYASVFLVDLDSDTYRFLYRNPESGFADVPSGVYSDTIREYTSRVDPAYQEVWTRMILPEDARTYLAIDNRREYIYPLTGVAKQWRRSVCHVIERRDGAAVRFVMTYTTLDAAAAESVRLSARIAEQNKQLAEQQLRLEAALESAEVANHSKSAFLFNMSHDIRTPMNAITGYAAMARKHMDDSARVSDCLDKIGIAGKNLLQLVNQVLDMSRIESGKVVLAEEPCDVVELAYEMLSVVRHSAESKNISLRCTTADIRQSRVYADAGRLNQLILNILGNAVKYTPEGGSVTCTVTQLPGAEDGYGLYSFSVKDTGIGMSAEYIQTIYEPFSREKSTTVSHVEGTGLGMSIVKRLVDLMKGTIHIESELGHGTDIIVTIPFRLQEEFNVNADEINDPAANIDFLRGRRVLLVEDNDMNREIATELLEEQGLLVDEAGDGDIAVDKIRATLNHGEPAYYDFVLMDIQMPRMDGFTATGLIRAMPWPDGYHLPIIAMTANAFDEDRRHALEAGMDEHLAKPIDVLHLWETLAKFIS